MKILKMFSLAVACMTAATISLAQDKTESFKVSGNCGMCKSKIEKSAKAAGASIAAWDKESKILTVSYNSSSTNTAKIQQNIAAAGYDNAGAKATQAAYDKLHGCCKYDREAATASKTCSEECKKACEEKGCCKPGEICEKECCKSGASHEGCSTEGEKSTKSCCAKKDKG